MAYFGGVSAYSSAELYREICYRYREKTKKFPEIVMYSIEVSEEEEKRFQLERDKEIVSVFEGKLRSACKAFKELNVDTVAIDCDTLSNVFEAIAKEYGFANILTPVNCMRKRLAKEKKKRPIVLGTDYTVKNGLFIGNSITQVKLHPDDQESVQKFITSKINSTSIEKDSLLRVLNKYSSMDSIIIGCTDISLEDLSGFASVPVFDSTTELISCCLDALG